jgi:hypothetical protein
MRIAHDRSQANTKIEIENKKEKRTAQIDSE